MWHTYTYDVAYTDTAHVIEFEQDARVSGVHVGIRENVNDRPLHLYCGIHFRVSLIIRIPACMKKVEVKKVEVKF